MTSKVQANNFTATENKRSVEVFCGSLLNNITSKKQLIYGTLFVYF